MLLSGWLCMMQRYQLPFLLEKKFSSRDDVFVFTAKTHPLYNIHFL
jgi:hypothetical protein